MLRSLEIENIAVIESAKLEFSTGFHALTGETGAGKSIIIDSIYAIMGERTSRELIRRGCSRAGVTACFTEVPPAVLQKLEECGIAAEPGEDLILKRTISADGHSRVWVNMQPANVGLLKELGKHLINIHGQFDNQNLLNPERHIDFVDGFAKNQALRAAYLKKFEQLKAVHKELNALLQHDAEARKRYDLLKYQIEELSTAELKPGELQKLREYLNRQQNSERLCGALQAAKAGISGNESEELPGAKDLLTLAFQALEPLTGEVPALQPLSERLTAAAYELEDLEALLLEQLEQNEYDPAGVQRATERLEQLRDLTAKYGGSEETALAYLQQAEQELQSIRQSSERQIKLEEQLEDAEQKLVAAGKALTNSRQTALRQICEKISQELCYLDFKSATFTANFKQGRYTKTGCDTLEFLISANAGEEPKPLAKVASGGELSRVMLAIRCVLSKSDDVGTLVFDEIDAGISGHAAVKVAQKLLEVSGYRQVICVTHLAQIAAAANRHLLIQKSEQNGRTFTDVTPITGKQRELEIARIIAGDKATETILASARELLNNFVK